MCNTIHLSPISETYHIKNKQDLKLQKLIHTEDAHFSGLILSLRSVLI